MRSQQDVEQRGLGPGEPDIAEQYPRPRRSAEAALVTVVHAGRSQQSGELDDLVGPVREDVRRVVPAQLGERVGDDEVGGVRKRGRVLGPADLFGSHRDNELAGADPLRVCLLYTSRCV